MHINAFYTIGTNLSLKTLMRILFHSYSTVLNPKDSPDISTILYLSNSNVQLSKLSSHPLFSSSYYHFFFHHQMDTLRISTNVKNNIVLFTLTVLCPFKPQEKKGNALFNLVLKATSNRVVQFLPK